MNKTACVYWIRHKNHSDIFTEGYIGVTKNHKIRWSRHKSDIKNNKHENTHFASAVRKYGWENLIKQIVLFADEKYCYEIESKLRQKEQTGWNINAGGTKPPISKSRGANYISPLKGKTRLVPWLIGRKNSPEARKKIAERRRVKVKYQDIVYESFEHLAAFLNIKYSTLTNRIYRNSKRWGYEVIK